MNRTRDNNSQGMEFFESELPRIGLSFVPSAANFLLVRVGDGDKIFREMQKLGVITRPMGGYGLPEFIRVSIGTPPENAKCLQALKTTLAK